MGCTHGIGDACEIALYVQGLYHLAQASRHDKKEEQVIDWTPEHIKVGVQRINASISIILRAHQQLSCPILPQQTKSLPPSTNVSGIATNMVLYCSHPKTSSKEPNCYCLARFSLRKLADYFMSFILAVVCTYVHIIHTCLNCIWF